MSLVVVCACANGQVKDETSPVTVAVTHIDDVLEKDKPALIYTQILSQIQQHSTHEFETVFAPSPRTSKMLRERQALCVFPGSKLSPKNTGNMIETEPVNFARAYLIGPEVVDAQQVTSTAADPLIIGYRRGNTFGGNIDKLEHHVLVELDDVSQLANMLIHERVDLVVAYQPDIGRTLGDKMGNGLNYGHRSLFYVQNESFLCHDTPRAHRFVAEIDNIILDMRNSGKLMNILGDAFWSPQQAL